MITFALHVDVHRAPGFVPGCLRPSGLLRRRGIDVHRRAPGIAIGVFRFPSTRGRRAAEQRDRAGLLAYVGREIVDANGTPVRIAGVNWFGFETSTFVPHGLWTRSYTSMLDQIKSLGFNAIRMPYSTQLFDPGTHAELDRLQSQPGSAGFERLADHGQDRRLRRFDRLAHHPRPASRCWRTQQSALWYPTQYPESRWISDWQMLATHYAGNPTVVGADLHNEPHSPRMLGMRRRRRTTGDWLRSGPATRSPAVNPQLADLRRRRR